MRPHVEVERDGAVSVVRLARPDARNAITKQMLCLLEDAWVAIDADDGVRAVVLAGEGATFSAGGDLKDLDADDPDGTFAARFASDDDLPYRALLRTRKLSKPVVAAIDGPAVGGGMELAMGADIRVASRSATFGVPEARRGLFPSGFTVRLPRLVGEANARYLLLTGRTIDAAEAHRIGFVATLVEEGGAFEAALGVAREIAANAPLSVAATRTAMDELRTLPEQEAFARETEIGRPVMASADVLEGIRAFVERREPRFEGR